MPPPRVLVVEDDPLFAKALGWRFGSLGYDVVVAGTMAEAMAVLGASAFCAVLLDLHLPDGGGRLAWEDVRARAPGAVVVPMTGWPLDECDVPGAVLKCDDDAFTAVVLRRLERTLDRLDDALQVAAAR